MSVLAATAAMGPSATVARGQLSGRAVPYGLCGGGGGGARKRKDVVWEEEDQVVVVAAPEVARKGDEEEEDGLFVLETVEEERSVSIDAAGSEEADEKEDEEEAEVKSKETTSSRMRKTKKCVGLSCLDTLDDALPIKRGLSNFFSGKSRSFANLQDVTSAASAGADVLAKPENPFNKRRRILRCSSIRRVSSTSLTALPPFLPPSSCTNTTILPSHGGTASSNGAHGGDGDGDAD